MRTRHALIGLALGGALVLAGTTATAHAAVAQESAPEAAAERRPVGMYATEQACRAAGDAWGVPYACAFWWPSYAWVLMVD
ncbi:hypothetical protein LG634_27285 [Streptomyces bambusae]|uniref:hypothetical protein n=1 Tax=Streptomyces bambusae TaxID=1550616 RepID=UPI001CFC616E|nr:hypothetical protein [Streptomyces bambusae]MCB5168514.1 hypothetical protein [Streptomyces bambusae]